MKWYSMCTNSKYVLINSINNREISIVEYHKDD